MPPALSIGSLSNMDNWHLFIILSLIAFGTGHAVFRARIGFWTFMLLVIFLVPLLFVYERSQMYILILTNVVLGFVFAHRQVVMDIIEDVRDGISQFFGFFSRLKPKSKPKPIPKPSAQAQTNQSSNNAWQEEQARREQEVRDKREQSKQEQQKQQKQQKQDYQSESEPQQNQQSNPPVTPTQTDRRTPQEILGLQPGFSAQELKQAYSRESARCHPDKWVGKPDAIREMMEEEQKLINAAYQKLK